MSSASFLFAVAMQGLRRRGGSYEMFSTIHTARITVDERPGDPIADSMAGLPRKDRELHKLPESWKTRARAA